MVVGVAKVSMYLAEASSLKDKRRVVKSVADRVRRRYNVAVAEVDTQESWGMMTIAIACVTNDAAHAHSMLQKVIRFIERERLDAEMADYTIEIL